MQPVHHPDCLFHIGLPCSLGCVESVEKQETTETPGTHMLCTPDCIPEFAIHSADCKAHTASHIREEKIDSLLTAISIVKHAIVGADEPSGPVCLQCSKVFKTDEIKITLKKGFVCLSCASCETCSEDMNISEMNFCMENDTPFQHARCRMKTNPIKIAVTEQELQLLNLCRLIIIPDVDVSLETNVNTARLHWGQLWETMTLEQKFLHTQMMETVYSAAYMGLKKDPTEVKNKLRERDNKRTHEAHEQARKDRMTQLPTERKKLANQEKFMNGMLASGVTREKAIEIWKSQGRVWVE